MLNKEKHQLVMGKILKDIYTDVSIAPLVGFKGGTCAYFFYSLPRFSVDLDFDLLSARIEDSASILEKISKIMKGYGTIKDKYVKYHTILAQLSYGDADHNVKIEVNTRLSVPNIKEKYELKEYLGISMLAAKKEYLFAGKLAALTLRGATAMRDAYDLYYFAKHNWDIDREALEAITGKKTKEYLNDCVAVIEKIKDNQVLQGLGELLSEKEKEWVRKNLKKETIFMLRNYESVIK